MADRAADGRGERAPIVDATIVVAVAEVPVSGGLGPPPPRGHEDDGRRGTADAASLGEGVALVRRVLAEATTPPRWPMYPRQFKQFLRAADPSFDERKYGSIAELMRACQKDGLLKLERDRQGGLRVFAAAGGTPRASVPHGWSILAGGQPSIGSGRDRRRSRAARRAANHPGAPRRSAGR